MSPSWVHSPVSLSFWVCPQSAEPRLQKGFADVRFAQVAGEYSIAQADRYVTVRLHAPRMRYELDSLLGSGRARLATVDQVAAEGTAVQLTLRFFNGSVLELGTIDVGMDERFVAATERLLKRGKMSVAGAAALLADLCVLRLGPHSEDSFFLVSTGVAASREFYTPVDPAGRSGSGAPPIEVPAVERAFCIHGDNIRIAVANKQVNRDEKKYLATHLTSSLGADPDGSVRLAHGRLGFSDFTRTGRIQSLAAGTMSQLTEAENSYLKKWDEYGAIEGEMLLARARQVGLLRWTSAEQLTRGGNGVKFFFGERLPAGISQQDSLEFVLEPPIYLEKPDLSFAQYSAALESEFDAKQGESRPFRKPQDPEREEEEALLAGVTAKVKQVDAHSLVLDLDVVPDKAGLYLILSLSGERAQIQRRTEARRLIQEGRSANPLLGLLIEENGVPPPPLRISDVKPLSAFVRQKVFAHPPTPNQQKAIYAALNTPDIALIQGPPGTGKTTVIAAIIERLNELADKGQPIQGEVLISAFQHDAIENMMARLTVNSIPVPKFGRRSGSLEVADRGAEQTRRFCSELAVRLRQKYPGLNTVEKLRDAQLRCHEYVLAPSLDNALGTIDAFLRVPQGHLPAWLVDQATALRERLEHERSGRLEQGDNDVLRALYSLRTSAEGFEDDGPAMAQGLLALCGGELPSAERELLARAAAWNARETPPFLADLRRAKGELLEWYRPRAVFRIDKPRKDVLMLVEQAAQCLLQGAASDAERTETILAEFLHELESNPGSARRAVEDYGFAFAATCQQTRGKAITKRKSRAAADRPGALDYDTVIIDEAARSSPRDLLIPMAQAKKRIILVGDHRQLPHIIDEAIARSLEERSAEDTPGEQTAERAADQEDSYIRRSMFQYLLSRLKKLQALDGFPRWVTLDQQFRMHPLLGNFVSDFFYRTHDADEAFGSPLPAEGFLHGLPEIPEVPALFIDVPTRPGQGEEREGTSCRREVEAQQIAKWIGRWIESPAGRKLTFGVISFYKAQEEEVYRALSKRGYTTRGADGKWRIAADYAGRSTQEGLSSEERLRIGTVDAFQGMEFDVVFLSMVRAKPRLPKPAADSAALAFQERKHYGHLTSPNRLCVSMSRQRRLLVVVGDRVMVENELAKNAIPGLRGFLALCKTHGAVLDAEG